MVAVPQPRQSSAGRALNSARSANPLELIQGSLSTRKVARHSPMLAGLHRATDGALLGVVMGVAVLSALTLHWQHRWTMAFASLESSRILAHRLTESTAMLERHLLERSKSPQGMVPTKAANLLYLDRPVSDANNTDRDQLTMLSQLMDNPINHGY